MKSQGVFLCCFGVTWSPKWYMRGGPQPAASGVVTNRAPRFGQAKRPELLKALLDPCTPQRLAEARPLTWRFYRIDTQPCQHDRDDLCQRLYPAPLRQRLQLLPQRPGFFFVP